MGKQKKKQKKKKKHGPRYKIPRAPGHYVERDKHGRFKKWSAIEKSIKVDARKKAKHEGKRPGYGHRKDYPKKKKKKKK